MLLKKRFVRLLALILPIIFTFIFGFIADRVKKTPSEEMTEALRLKQFLIDSFSGYRVGIICKKKSHLKDVYMESSSEYRYKLFRIQNSSEELYKQFAPSGDKIMFLDGIDMGLYKVQLDFYGYILDQTDIISVGKNIIHIIEFHTQGHDAQVFFSVSDRDGRPIDGAWIEITNFQGIHIRGNSEMSVTDKSGKTKKPLWIPTLPSNSIHGYVAKVYKDNKIIGMKEFKVTGSVEHYEQFNFSIDIH